MATAETPPLPTRCCANCGFLFALASNSVSPDEAAFDPDLVRAADYPPLPFPDYTPPGQVSSRLYTYRYYLVGPGKKVEEHELGYYTWVDTCLVACYWKKFNSIRIAARKNLSSAREEDMQIVPLECDFVLETIRQDRADCPGYFDYYPGLTPRQHLELRLEENRAGILRQHEANLAAWALEQEGRLQGVSNEFLQHWQEGEFKLRERDKRLLRRVTLAGLLAALVIAVVQPVLTYYLPTLAILIRDLLTP